MGIQRDFPDRVVEVWAEDEARLGLKPITRRMWWTKGVRPVVRQHRRYQWLHAYCFVHPMDGDTHWLLAPTVNTAAMNIALRQFAEYANPRGDKVIVLLLDRAGWHRTQELVIPEGIRVFPLPAYTPELQPSECVWPLLRESVANRPIHTLGRLERLLINRCRYLMANQEVVQQRAGFDWIVQAEERARKGLG